MWETFLLVRKKRLEISTDFTTWLAHSLNVLPVIEAPLTFEVTRTLLALLVPHEDPADLFLAQQPRCSD